MKNLIILFIFITTSFIGQSHSFKIGILKYNGGGDWYANPTALKNLIQFCNTNLNTNIDPMYDEIEVGNLSIFQYPWVHLTGHGNVVFSPKEANNLRNYLISGGFLHISDNYGLDPFIRKEMKKVFPEIDFVELPLNHEIYETPYAFKNGLPKIHEHDDNSPLGLGLIYEGRLVCFYDFECDLGDGWEDEEVHNDSEEIRTKALKMGANILSYALMGPNDTK
ncbi:MAG: DUF4159 domain-containing protein [Bacteroidota bacterium]|nr:DUF4159 domain-containing protein [Bacteroidota bacterium]MEC7062900.1 DUF4159 domain-containing protein [Bacteroidota bacterium]MEC7998488.1 DUF4159 domain-containing protein [Bacteroidota bacterium]MEC8407820.1 DUF4159 domain-containing protein [Bacteroidota bacterium]MEC8460277.1 DUF4159 domain-containing protein [Bacteroidota bacterium]